MSAYIFPHLGFRVAYDGKPYSGFQKQPRDKTIQDEIEKALGILFKAQISIDFSSRTDTGVHALDQMVFLRNGYSLWESLSDKKQKAFLLSLNSILPDAIRVREVMRLRADYHPKHSALWKEYHYRVVMGAIAPPLERGQVLWIRRPLDIDAMKRSIKSFVGTHDFRAFGKRIQRYEGDTVRKILRAELHVGVYPTMKELTHLRFVFRGEGFLHHMVRTMVGTLLEVGQGENHLISRLLKSGVRSEAGVNAPGHPLVLVKTQIPKKFQVPL